MGYFLIGFPIIYTNLFNKDKGLIGIWEGTTAAVCFITVSSLIVACTIDWEARIQECAEQRALDNKEMVEEDARFKKELEELEQKNQVVAPLLQDEERESDATKTTI